MTTIRLRVFKMFAAEPERRFKIKVYRPLESRIWEAAVIDAPTADQGIGEAVRWAMRVHDPVIRIDKIDWAELDEQGFAKKVEAPEV